MRLRLAWNEPGPTPAWLAACHAALSAWRVPAGQAHGIRIDSIAPGPAAPMTPTDRCLSLAAPPSRERLAGDADGTHWWLTDAHGQPLDARHPLLDDITAGRGVALALWAPRARGRGWICLRRTHVAASPRYALGRLQLPLALARLVAQACLDWRLGVPAPRRVHRLPGPTTGARGPRQGRAPRDRPPGIVRLSCRLLRGHWKAWLSHQRARWLREDWRIGVVEAPLATFTQSSAPLRHTRWLAPCRDLGYWADPAGQAGSHSRILAEYFDEKSGMGRIEQLRLDGDGISERLVLPLGKGRHASFPLAVQLGGRWLGLAETAALRACELYEIDPCGQWRPLATLLPGRAAVDPALFHWDDRYWLAFTDLDLGAADNLCLYHAEQPEGPWLPHANNPVKVDVAGARMAGGFFWHGGALYRPAQDCLDTYGAGVVMHRVLRCSPTEFEEEAVRYIAPDPLGPCPDGLHTINAWGARTLVDGKRHIFSLRLVWLKLRRRLARSAAGTPPAMAVGGPLDVESSRGQVLAQKPPHPVRP